MNLGRWLPLVLAPLLTIACAGTGDAASASSESNLDTSGCSGLDLTTVRGAVHVSVSRPPTSSCWNIAESGLSLTYSWAQTNSAEPEKNDVGFYAELNGAGTFVKADAYACEEAPGGGLGKDTSGTRYFECTARKRIDFGHAPELLNAAYGKDGHRVPWDVQIAVALDDAGHWDSLNGANYRFSF